MAESQASNIGNKLLQPGVSVRLAAAAVAARGMFELQHTHILNQYRDSLPEPFDVADHYNNLPPSVGLVGMGVIAAGSVLAARQWRTAVHGERLSVSSRKSKAAFILASSALGIALNIGFETNQGLEVAHDIAPQVQHYGHVDIGEKYYADPIDATYGIGTTLLTATFVAGGITVRRREEAEPPSATSIILPGGSPDPTP